MPLCLLRVDNKKERENKTTSFIWYTACRIKSLFMCTKALLSHSTRHDTTRRPVASCPATSKQLNYLLSGTFIQFFLTFCSRRKHTFRNYTQYQASSLKGLPKQSNQQINQKLVDNMITYTFVSHHGAKTSEQSGNQKFISRCFIAPFDASCPFLLSSFPLVSSPFPSNPVRGALQAPPVGFGTLLGNASDR